MARGPRFDDARLTARRSARWPGLIGLACALVGCGSASIPGGLPPAAGPDRSPALAAEPAGRALAPTTPPEPRPRLRTTLREGSLEVSLDPRARQLSVFDLARKTSTGPPISVGVGPTQVACVPEGPCFVVDTQGDALLVVRIGEGGRDVRLTRRVYLAGAPYAIAVDPERRRLWITLTARNEVVELGAHGRPHVLQRLPTIRQPDAVAVDPASGDVTVTAPDGTRQRLTDPDRQATG